MRFLESLKNLSFRFYSIRYGEEEARNLLQLRGKARAKHLAMLDEHGADASQLEAQRELSELFDESVNAIAEANYCASRLEDARRRDIKLRELLSTESDPETVTRYDAELQLVAKAILTLPPHLEKLNVLREDKAGEYDAKARAFSERYGDFKPELGLRRSKEPSDRPKTNTAWRRKLEKDMASVFASTLGMKAANKITSAPPSERWRIAAECMDSETFDVTQPPLIQGREAYLRLSTTKYRLMEIQDYLLLKMAVVEAVPAPNDPSDDAYKEQLASVEQLIAESTDAVELAKVVMLWLERETKQRSATNQTGDTVDTHGQTFN